MQIESPKMNDSINPLPANPDNNLLNLFYQPIKNTVSENEMTV